MVTLSFFWHSIRIPLIILLISGLLVGIVIDLMQIAESNSSNYRRDVLLALAEEPNENPSYDVGRFPQDIAFALGAYSVSTFSDKVHGPVLPHIVPSGHDSVGISQRLSYLIVMKDLGLKLTTEANVDGLASLLQEILLNDSSLTLSEFLNQCFKLDKFGLSVSKKARSEFLGIPEWSLDSNHFIRNYFRMKSFKLSFTEDSTEAFIRTLKLIEVSEYSNVIEFLQVYFRLIEDAEEKPSELGVSVFGTLREAQDQLVLASIKSLSVDAIPTLQEHSWYKDKQEFLWWWYLILTISTILFGFIPRCYGFGRSDGDKRKFYLLQWGRPIVYLHVLVWLPGFLVWIPLWIILSSFVWFIEVLSTDWLHKHRVHNVEQVIKEDHSDPDGKTERSKKVDASTVWFFVDNSRIFDRIPEGAFEKLAAKGIPISDTQITTSDSTFIGITFPAEHWQAVFSEFGIKPINIRKTNLNQDNIVLFEYDDPEGFLADKRSIFESNKPQYAKQYVVECRKGVEIQILDEEDQIDINNAEVSEAMQVIATKRSENDIVMKKLSGLHAAMESEALSDDKLLGDFEQLCNLEHIVSVEVDNGVIRIYTDALHIEHGGLTYLLGEYQITIDTALINLTWKNLFHSKRGHHDAYHGCLGNVATGITQFLADRDYVHAVQVLLKFLQSVHGSYITNLKDWEVV